MTVPHRKLVTKMFLQAASSALVFVLGVVTVFGNPPAEAKTSKETVLYTFVGPPEDGNQPSGSLIMDAKGNLYGTTQGGGSDKNGVVFKLDPTTRKETVLYSFTGGADGSQPWASLIMDAQGNLYGTTTSGGSYKNGVVFKLDPTTRKETVLYSFIGGADGGSPQAGLIMDAQGNLYGTTNYGGSHPPNGVVFKLDPTTRKETVLHSFGQTSGDGTTPTAGLIMDAQGNLYGTTLQGGSDANGVVFKLDPTTRKETVLHRFTGGADGSQPLAGLIMDAKGNLYGTTTLGGYGGGVVFKLDPTTRKETVLHEFIGGKTDGETPYAGLIFDAQGNLYGTTTNGGDEGCECYGVVFKLDPTTRKETVLHSFGQTSGDGTTPWAGLIMDAKGNLYGTAWAGGAYYDGVVFKVTP